MPSSSTARHQRPDKSDVEHGSHAEQLVGYHLEPATQCGLPSIPAQLWDRQFDQIGRPLEILGGQRMVDRFGRLAVLLVPDARPPMQLRNGGWLLVQQVRLQNVGKEPVIAIPMAMIIKRYQEQVASFERREPGSVRRPVR